MLLTGLQCVFSCFYRAKLRAQLGLREDPCPDCLVHFFCEWCALCQEYRELKKRGFDMKLGTISQFGGCLFFFIHSDHSVHLIF